MHSQQEKLREDKTFFKKQIVVSKEELFEKTIPTWASDFDMLARVLKVQEKQREIGVCTCSPSQSRMTRSQQTNCQCMIQESQEVRQERIKQEKRALELKVKDMVKEKQIRGLKQHFTKRAQTIKNDK